MADQAPTQRCPDCQGDIGVQHTLNGSRFACGNCGRVFATEELLTLTDADTTTRPRPSGQDRPEYGG